MNPSRTAVAATEEPWMTFKLTYRVALRRARKGGAFPRSQTPLGDALARATPLVPFDPAVRAKQSFARIKKRSQAEFGNEVPQA